jgi:hypothetical protein
MASPVDLSKLTIQELEILKAKTQQTWLAGIFGKGSPPGANEAYIEVAREFESRLTPVHEAGHAVAALELNVEFGMVSIIQGEASHGSVSVENDDGIIIPPGTDPYSPENELRYRAWAQEQAIIDYAGHAAVVVLLGIGDMSWWSARCYGAQEDFDKAKRRLGRRQKPIQAARKRAIEIVTARADDVRKLARALSEHKRLDPQQVDLILADMPFDYLTRQRD